MSAVMLKRLAVLCITSGLALCFPAHAKETLVFAHLFSETSMQHQALLEADLELAERSGGELRLDIRPHGELGDQDSRIMEAIFHGSADMTYVGGSFAARDYAPIGVIDAPYAFHDYQHWQHFKTSALAQELATEYEKSSGMIVLGYCYFGARHISSKVPIRGLEDLEKLRIRVPNAPIYLQLFRSLGAVAVPVPFGKVYDALKQGAVDAQESPLSTIEDRKLYELTPYVSLTGHITDDNLILVRAERLRRLTAEQQQLVRTVFAKMAERLSNRMYDREQEDMDKLKKVGVTFISVNRDAFAAKAAAMVQGSSFVWSRTLYDQLQKIP